MDSKIFFFSSRRRHTRLRRDWSSDVCSSDLQVDEESSLQIGDIITEVNRELVTNTNNFIELIETIKKTGRNSLLLKIIRDDKSLWITIQFLK